jgi:hypothetical protein
MCNINVAPYGRSALATNLKLVNLKIRHYCEDVVDEKVLLI